MKAWQVSRPGEPEDVLELASVPGPVPGPGQLLVRVLAAAANFPDALLCRGTYQVRPALPFCPGIELCGEVTEAGAGVTGFAAGDRVIGGSGANVVYDPVGGEAFRRSTKCVAFEGRIVIVGFASGDIPLAALNHALVKNYSVLGLHWGLYERLDPGAVRDCHAELTRLAAAGAIRPLISERLTLADVPDGLRRLAGGGTTGRIVFLP